MKLLLSIAAAASALALATSAQAQFQKPEDAIKYRQSALFVMGQHFGRLGAMANGRIPYDAKVAVENAELIAAVAVLPWAGFGPGTDKGTTKAKPEVWSDAAKFKEAADKMTAETTKLVAAAKAGNADALKAAFGPTAGSCKACHDTFRSQ